MGGSRSRASRRRPLHSLPSSSLDLRSLCTSLQTSLQSSSRDPELQSILSALSHPLSPSAQNQLGAALHHSVLKHPPTSSSIRHCLAKICFCLPHWHLSSPSAALSALTAIATLSLSPNQSSDTAALSAALGAVAAVARAALPSRPSREQVERHVPSLVEPVHAALFRPRSAPFADNTSDSGSGLYSDRDGSSSISPRLHTVRYASLDALQALAAVASRALIPFWGMFLPDREGVPRRAARGRDTLATILLFERDAQLRSSAVSAIIALLASARTFIQNATHLVRPDARQTALAFTSTSSRVLRASAALHTVVASALPTETSGIVVAKLAKLAAELASSMPVPAVPFEKVQIVIQALRNRLLDEKTTDLTSRAAAASAIVVALAKSGDHMAVADLEHLCQEVVDALRRRCQGIEQPVLELLGILRNAVILHPCLFRRMFEDMDLPVMHLAVGDATPGVCLHCIRLIEAFLAHSVRFHFGRDYGVLTDVERGQLLLDVELGWVLYRNPLKGIMLNSCSPAQASAVSTVDSIMRLTSLAHSIIEETALAITEPESVEGVNGEGFALIEAIELLKRTVVSDCGDSVKICALRSLASVPVSCVSKALVCDVLHDLDQSMRDDSSDVSVRGKAMSSFSALVDKALLPTSDSDKDIFVALQVAADFAAEFLNYKNGNVEKAKAATNRSGMESSDIAAVNLVACALRHAGGSSGTWLATREPIRMREDSAAILAWVLQSGKSVNTKCMCCKAVGRALRDGSDRTGRIALKSDHALLEALEWSLEHGVVRLQLAAANVLKDLIVARPEPEDILTYLLLSVRKYEAAASKIRSKKVGGKETTQLIVLQGILAASVFETLQTAGQELLQMLSKSWGSSPGGNASVQSCLDAVLQHLSFPGLLAEHLELSEKGKISSLHQEARLMLQSLPLDAQAMIREVLNIKKVLSSSKDDELLNPACTGTSGLQQTK